jgi:hypothetical protein
VRAVECLAQRVASPNLMVMNMGACLIGAAVGLFYPAS